MMASTYKPKHKLLKEFTKILFKHNPMQFNLKGNPHAAIEYESEALSILSRLHECIMLIDDKEQLDVTIEIVKRVFTFWFDEQQFHHVEKLSASLLNAYKSSYPALEQLPKTEVPSTT